MISGLTVAMMINLNHFHLSTMDNDDLAKAFATPWMTETEKVSGTGPDFIVTTRMSERELRYLIECFFGGEGTFHLSVAPV